jgi:hypothetical protein
MATNAATKKNYTKFSLESACAHIKMMDGKQTVGWIMDYIPSSKEAPEHWRLTRRVFINVMTGFKKQIQ